MPNKKAIMIEALIRILIAALLIFGAIMIGKRVGEAFFGGSVENTEFRNLVRNLNEMESGEGPLIRDIVLDKGSVIVAVGSEGDFKCINCINILKIIRGDIGVGIRTSTQKDLIFTKPKTEECKDNCICLCRESFLVEEVNKYRLDCDKLSCEKIENKVIDKISLNVGDLARDSDIDKNVDIHWEKGFMYLRGKGSNPPQNGLFPPNQNQRQQVYLEKGTIGGETFSAVCPYFGCLLQKSSN